MFLLSKLREWKKKVSRRQNESKQSYETVERQDRTIFLGWVDLNPDPG